MARYTGPVCRLCRREGVKLFLKGDRCYSGKCAMEKRSYAPGQHGNNRRRKMSEYAVMLAEKQKAKYTYGVLERQFRNMFEHAAKAEGITGEVLLQNLESRLDNVVFRMGLATTRKEARQIVGHKHVLVNGKRVNIPSYQIKAGDTVEIREKSKGSQRYKDILEVTGARLVPEWLEADQENLSGTVKALPTREQIDVPVNEMLIVELYSK